MADELIDLLDDSGIMIGTIMKSQAHRTNAWHKAIHVYIVNEKKELLLQFRSANKDLYPSIWDISCGGHVGAGESTLHTAIREVGEELGLTIPEKDMQYLFTYQEELSNGKICSREFVDVFLVQLLGDAPITLQESEVAQVKFVPLEIFFKMVENKEKDLIPHHEEYEKIIPILKSIH